MPSAQPQEQRNKRSTACFYSGQAYLSYTERNEHIEHLGKLLYPTPEDLSVYYDVLISQIIKNGI